MKNYIRVCLSLDPNIKELLVFLSELYHLSMSEVVKKLIVEKCKSENVVIVRSHTLGGN